MKCRPFGVILKEARESTGQTLAQFCQHGKLNKGSLNRWEHGGSLPAEAFPEIIETLHAKGVSLDLICELESAFKTARSVGGGDDPSLHVEEEYAKCVSGLEQNARDLNSRVSDLFQKCRELKAEAKPSLAYAYSVSLLEKIANWPEVNDKLREDLHSFIQTCITILPPEAMEMRLSKAIAAVGQDPDAFFAKYPFESLNQYFLVAAGLYNFSFTDAFPPEYDGWTQLNLGNVPGQFYTDFELNQLLVEGSLDRVAVEMAKEPLSLRDLPVEVCFGLHQVFDNRNAVVFNKGKLSLKSDVTRGFLTGTSDKSISLQKSTFYDFLCTNRIAAQQLLDSHGNQIFDGRSLFTARHSFTSDNPFLLNLRRNKQASIIGVNTLAITKDYHVVMHVQNNSNIQGGGQRVPSGSGSAEWEDLGTEETPRSLQQVVRNGCLRELEEEIGVLEDHVAIWKLIGYTCELSRGWKPDFFSVAFLNITMDELVERHAHHRRDPFAGPVFFEPLEKVSDFKEVHLKTPVPNQFLVVNLILLEKAWKSLEMCLD